MEATEGLPSLYTKHFRACLPSSQRRALASPNKNYQSAKGGTDSLLSSILSIHFYISILPYKSPHKIPPPIVGAATCRPKSLPP